jgi:hypothetical protein
MTDYDRSHITATEGATRDGVPSFTIEVNREQGADLWRALRTAGDAGNNEVAAVAADRLRAAIALIFGDETDAKLQEASR